MVQSPDFYGMELADRHELYSNADSLRAANVDGTSLCPASNYSLTACRKTLDNLICHAKLLAGVMLPIENCQRATGLKGS